VKFLLACPLREGTARVGRDLGRALADAGHAVTAFDYDDGPFWLRAVPRRLRDDGWRRRWLDAVNHRVLRAAREARPDVFLCVKGVQFRPETIRTIASAGVTTVGYWIDDPLDHERSLANAPSYDFYFTNDSASVERYRSEGVRRVHHLASSADTGSFHPLPGTVPDADVSFVGTWSPHRQSVLAPLQDLDLRVYGPGWHKSSLRRSCIHPEMFGAKTNEVFNRSRINLNIHNWFGRGAAMNLRLFEVPASGAFLLTDWIAEVDGAYTEGQHLECWRTPAELREKIAYYLAHEAERSEIARRGRQHFLNHHTYAARVRQVLERLDAERAIQHAAA
jgi:spore maturation protein CgeB